MNLKHLMILCALAMAVLCNGCITKKQLRKTVNDAVGSCQGDLEEKNERLRKFNQLNEDDTLR